jgi:hypothetical protein
MASGDQQAAESADGVVEMVRSAVA